MKATIMKVADKGNIRKERIILRARAGLEIGEYLLLQSAFEDDSVTTTIFETYWFPDKAVKKGDIIVLYTKAGRANQTSLSNNRAAHFFYWGKSKSIWGNLDRAPVLMHAPEWISKAPDEL